MAKLEIHQFPCLSDNYGVLIHDSGGATAAIDVPDAKAGDCGPARPRAGRSRIS